MAALKLRMACDAATLAPLIEGTIRLEDVDLEIERVAPRERHHRMLHDLTWDVCEYSSANLMTGLVAGLPFSAVPVFPLRTFRHRDIWVTSDIEEPSQLSGKRIGIQNWDNSAALWQRGPLQHDFDLDLGSVDWVCMIPPEAPDFSPPSWLRMTQAPEGRTLQEMMLAGELQGLMVPFPPNFPPEAEGNVRRLFPNFTAVEQAFWAQYGVYPIMHTIVIKNSVLEQHPWVAQRVYDGMQQAIDAFVERKRAENAPSLVWPGLTWAEQELHLGRQPWPAGVEANRATLQTAIDYGVEQGMLTRPLAPEELFQRDGEPLIAES